MRIITIMRPTMGRRAVYVIKLRKVYNIHIIISCSYTKILRLSKADYFFFFQYLLRKSWRSSSLEEGEAIY